MFRMFLQAVILIGVLVIRDVQSIEFKDAVEKRGQKALVDMVKELSVSLNILKEKLQRIESRRLLRIKGPRGSQGPSDHRGARGPPGRNGGGVEYIRWGRTSCPYGADKVYKGRIGGGYYNADGGGSNYVCLPENPRYLKYKPGYQEQSYIYGSEYEVSSFNPFSRSNLNNHDAPCVACHVKTRSSKLMIPATYQCPSGWTREYYGYLMAEKYYHKHSSEYICVDTYAETVPGTHASIDGALLYPVEGVCGSLPCPPYIKGAQLTCVVCSK